MFVKKSCPFIGGMDLEYFSCGFFCTCYLINGAGWRNHIPHYIQRHCLFRKVYISDDPPSPELAQQYCNYAARRSGSILERLPQSDSGINSSDGTTSNSTMSPAWRSLNG